MDAATWDERYRVSGLVWGVEPNQFVRELCERLPIGHAVDLACGEGRNSLWLARLGWYVTGVDYSEVAIQRAVELTAQEDEAVRMRVLWRVADVTAEPPKPRSADLVILSYLHLPPTHGWSLMRAAAHAVRPGGHVVAVGHDRRNLAEGVGGPQDAQLLYVPGEIAALLREERLVVELAETMPRLTPAGTALDTVVHARLPLEAG